MRITKKYFLAFTLLSFFAIAQIILFNPAAVSAQSGSGSSVIQQQEGLTEIGTVYGADGGAPQDIRYIIARIISVILGFLGIIFFGLVIFAGFQYMTSAGNDEKIKKALGLLKNALIGLVIILVSWGITRYVTWTMGRAVNGSKDFQTYQSYP